MNGKLDLPDWIDEGAALRSIASKLSLHFSGPAPSAQTVLSAAVLSGDIRAREKRGKLSVVLSATDWAERAQDGVLYLRGEEVNREDLQRWLDWSDKRPAEGLKRGRKFIYDWEACWAFMAVYVYEHGYPEKQTELANIVERWFIDNEGDAPSISQINERVSRLYKEKAQQETKSGN